jgi:hypothetical protein
MRRIPLRCLTAGVLGAMIGDDKQFAGRFRFRGERAGNHDAYHLIKSRLDFIIIQKTTMKCFYKIPHLHFSTEDGYFFSFLVQNSPI